MSKKQIIPQISYEKQIKDLKDIYRYFFFNNLQLKENKIKINKFFNLYKFVIIYFFVGSFFVQNKLNKTLQNVVRSYENFLKISKITSNVNEEFYKFLYSIKTKNKLNIKNTLFLCNSKFYLPKNILNNQYFYLKIIYIYLKKIKTIFNFFNIYILKFLFILNNNSNTINKKILFNKINLI